MRSSHVFKAFVQIVVLLLLLVNPLPAQNGKLALLDKYIEKTRQDWEIPGLAVAIVKDDKVVFARGYGVRTLGEAAKVDENTLFAVASNSKAFTTTLLAMQADAGLLAWDDPVTEHLPDFQMFDPYVTRALTIRDLVTHRAGLPTYGGDHLWIGHTLSRADILRRIRHLAPTASFRSKYQYQNLMFLVAGELSAKVAGKSWDELMSERIFQPLGMSRANTSVRKLPEMNNVASPHEYVNGELTAIPYDNLDNVAPAAAVNASVNDMAQWMRFNLNKGKVNGETLVSEGQMRQLHRIQMPVNVSRYAEKFYQRQFAGYGLGWFISDYQGIKLVGHGGGMSGMISLQTLVPSEGLGIMIVTNFAPSSPTRAITHRILDVLLDIGERDWSTEMRNARDNSRKSAAEKEKAIQAERKKGTTSSLSLTDLAGTYHNDLSGDVVLSLKNEKLWFEYNARHRGYLAHWHYNTFRITWDNPIYDMPAKSFISFYLDEGGAPEKFQVTFYDPMTFYRTPPGK